MADLALKALVLGGKLITNKVIAHIVLDLKESDVTGKRFREMIIKPLDEIKEKLDSMARVELQASLMFFQEGMTLLHGFLKSNPVHESRETETVTSLDKCLAVLEVNKSSGGTQTSPRPDRVDEAHSFIEEAKYKFHESANCAVKAISNDALKLADRVFAVRLRIIATILRHIDNDSMSLTLCKSFLMQLNSMAEVINNFKVHLGKGTVTALKKKLNSDERIELILSVASVNKMVWNYAHLCQADDNYFTDWPSIDLDTKGKLHPVLDGCIREICGVTFVSQTASSRGSVSVAENGRFLVASPTSRNVSVILPNGRSVCRCHFECISNHPGIISSISGRIPSTRSSIVGISESGCDLNPFGISSQQNLALFVPTYAVAVNDKIFASSSRETRDDIPLQAKVFVFNSSGSFEETFGTDIFTAESILTSMAICNNELLVVDDHTDSIHVFSLNGGYSGKLASWVGHSGYSYIAVTPDNRVYKTHSDSVRIYDIDKANSRDREHSIPGKRKELNGIAYDSSRDKLYVFVKDTKTRLHIYDKELNFEGSIELPKSCCQSKGIAVTSTGFVAMFDTDSKQVIVI